MQIASERTGYPVEMLGLDQHIEADLGIDSIKRVEILGAFQKRLPPPLAQRFQEAMEDIAELTTFGALIERLKRLEGSPPFEDAGKGGAALSRFIVKAHPESVDHIHIPPLPEGLYLVTEDALGIAPHLAARLQRAGGTPCLIPQALWGDTDALEGWLAERRREGPIAGFIYLPLAMDPWDLEIPTAMWRERMAREVKALFPLLRLLKEDLAQGKLLVASAMGGTFGRFGADSHAFPGNGGLSGLVKTLTLE
ncbi:MAG: hypothetical protein D6819_10925, partial [Gammaproteobacteria bacterium]